MSNKYKAQAAREYFERLLSAKAIISLSKIRKKRTIDQNALYWMWLTCIERETGIRKEELHLLYRATYLYRGDEYVSQIITGTLLNKVKNVISQFHYFQGMEEYIDVLAKSTTDLETKEMSQYMEKIRDHASMEMGVLLLTLEEEGFNDFINEYER